jgi:elongation factor Ts
MPTISAQDVKELRDTTGVGMMDCKKALQEADGDFDRAVELLRKKGQQVAAKRSDKEASEGLVVTALADDGSTGAIAEVNCETDFVARNDDFKRFANEIARLVLREQPADLDALMTLTYEGETTLDNPNPTVERELTDLTGKIGEKIEIRRFQVLTAADAGRAISYVHPGSRLGVLVEVTGDGNLEAVGRDLAMQVAALSPIAARREDVPAEVEEKEREIARDAAQNEDKPEHVLDQIVDGKMERFYEDNVLIEQPFVKDSSVTVEERLDDAGTDVRGYVRFALGE